MKKKLNGIKKRIDEYDDMHIQATFAKISTDLDWIKTKLIELSNEHSKKSNA